jgi:hypothetical protein
MKELQPPFCSSEFPFCRKYWNPKIDANATISGVVTTQKTGPKSDQLSVRFQKYQSPGQCSSHHSCANPVACGHILEDYYLGLPRPAIGCQRPQLLALFLALEADGVSADGLLWR